MVVGEKEKMMTAPVNSQPPPAQQIVPSPSAIDNIMSGISNTGAVRMNNHRKKLRQRYVPCNRYDILTEKYQILQYKAGIPTNFIDLFYFTLMSRIDLI